MIERKENLSNAIIRKLEPGPQGDVVVTFALEFGMNFIAALEGATMEEHIIVSLVILPSAFVARKVGVLLGGKPEISLTHHWFTDEEQL